ncbi:TetR/AcrR family transcriptional regulator C-terminal domain-containing protein [Streptomyces tubbatahanensis]|uniref:TetR/AcrR family transcriptional regulator C-terminal domain-containing protein n=1 Tax=Streptomyces tubbatahanensis TaxID=2923272 RepID=A0ABY3XX95_9ACTN|nr:TetR/AcrR family transcriptional regulator C-terminal domain-containing protein [Streptomyces tubbatahanensis]UNS99131.1 TetR/AcrR family transcriptional regulator C-terminal domain-containing protein [Streptomyces tubbatahanensis]
MALRKSDVVDAALRFLDIEGLDQLTMRKLGASLNVHGGALYRHFPNKEALLDAVADKIVQDMGDPLPDSPWTDQVEILGNRLRTALLSHRDGARVVAGTFAPGVNTIVGSDMAVQVLCRAGLPPAQAGWVTFALFYYVLGHTIEEQAQRQLPSDNNWRVRNERLDVQVSPQFAVALDSLWDTDPAERFQYGLRVFVEGLSHLAAPSAQQTRPASGDATREAPGKRGNLAR